MGQKFMGMQINEQTIRNVEAETNNKQQCLQVFHKDQIDKKNQ